eukprot:jgi/Mesvir1/27734/Mv07429-RA.1
MFKGQRPEEILAWLEDAWRQNALLSNADMLAALKELRPRGPGHDHSGGSGPEPPATAAARDAARDPGFLLVLGKVWARFDVDPGSFSNRDLETLARTLAKSGGDVSKQLDRMEGEAIKRLGSMNPKEFTGVAWAFAKASRGDAVLAAVDEQLVQRGLVAFTAQGISNIMWAFASTGKGRPELYATVESEVMRRSLAEFTPQGLSNLVWSFATAGMKASQLFAAVDKEVLARGLQGFNPQETTNLVWAFATAGEGSVRLFAAIEADVVIKDLGEFTEQGLSNLVWAFATADKGGRKLFLTVERVVIRRGLAGFRPQGLSNLVWAFATAEQDTPRLFAVVEAEVESRGLGEFNQQEISNLVWAFATSRQGTAALFSTIEEEVAERGLAGFKEQGVSNLAWSFASAEKEGAILFPLIEQEVAGRGLADFRPQHLSNVVWSFATAGRAPAELFAAVEAESLGRGLEMFNSQQVSNLLWAFATAGQGTPELYSAAEGWVETRALRGRHLGDAEKGQGVIERLYMAAEEGIAEWVKEGVVAQNAANMLWALAAAGRADSPAGRALLVAWAKLTWPSDGDFWLHLSQVCQYILACVDPRDHARDRYCAALLQKWQGTPTKDKKQPGPSSSDFHVEVSRVLQDMGIDHENEASYFNGLLYIDILVNGIVAVEVDGPSHFYLDSGATTAATQFKWRLLERGGFKVASIPYFHWITLKGRDDKKEYLRHKLQSAL